MSEWVEHQDYWECLCQQTSEEWFSIKEESKLLTCSNFGSAVGHNDFNSPDDVVEMILGKKKKEMNEAMLHGIQTEPKARKWYEERFCCKIKESGIFIPKWDLRIGASLDGEVEGTNGMIEIKCPKKMYFDLTESNVPIGNGRIISSYYDQMQGCMAITNKEWCDFIVYCEPENRVFVKRVIFDKKYWNDVLYPKIDEFLSRMLNPICQID